MAHHKVRHFQQSFIASKLGVRFEMARRTQFNGSTSIPSKCWIVAMPSMEPAFYLDLVPFLEQGRMTG
jgi:hypothetical protein